MSVQPKHWRLIGSGEPISGKEALDLGLVSIGAKDEAEVIEKAKALAAKFAEKSPQTLASLLELLYSNKVYSYEGSLKLEAKRFGEAFESEDAKEGIQAFLEKESLSSKANKRGYDHESICTDETDV